MKTFERLMLVSALCIGTIAVTSYAYYITEFPLLFFIIAIAISIQARAIEDTRKLVQGSPDAKD